MLRYTLGGLASMLLIAHLFACTGSDSGTLEDAGETGPDGDADGDTDGDTDTDDVDTETETESDEDEDLPFLPYCEGDFDAPVPTGSLDAVPGEVVYWRESPISNYFGANRIYTTSPSIVALPTGEYLIAFNLFGDSLSPSASDSGTTYIYRSSDQGLNWENLTLSPMMDVKRASLFALEGDLYLWGYTAAPGPIIVKKSTDQGETWTVPEDDMTGLLTSGTRSGTPLNPAIHDGRLWMAVGGKRVMSVSASQDLLDASNWAGPSQAANTDEGPIGSDLNLTEAQIVAAPHTGPVVMPKIDGIAYTTLIRATGNQAVADPADADWIPLPGGDKKFGAGYDPESGRFYVLSNPVLPVHHGHGFLTPQLIRNTAALLSSTDLARWDVEQLFLYSPHIDYEAFQYFNFHIDGDDIIIASRTAFDIGGAFKPPRGHDSNLITFHRIVDFRDATSCHFLRVDGNTIQRYELTQHGHAPLGSFVLGSDFDGSPLGTVTGIARAPLGQVLVGEQGGRILRFDALGNFIEVLSSSAAEFQTAALGISQPPYGERAWITASGGDWKDLENWHYWGRPDTEYEIANFGSAINSASTIALNQGCILKGIRFRSAHRYTLAGSGAIDFEADNGVGILETQRGSHRIELPVTLHNKVDATLHESASVHVAGSIDLNGNELSVAGPGAMAILEAFAMNGGRLVLDGLSALTFSSPVAVTLNGSLQFHPDTSLALVEGAEFALMDVGDGLSGEFEEVLLPELPVGLFWDVSRLYSQGIVQIGSGT